MASDPRVLVIEDDFLIALALCEELRVMGLIPVGPIGSLQDAFGAVRQGDFDIALVDINLKEEMSFPLVEQLMKAGVPQAIMTAYSDDAIPDRFSMLPRLEKPFSVVTLRDLLLTLGMPPPPDPGADAFPAEPDPASA